MNTTEMLNSKTPNRCTKHRVALKPAKQLLAVSVGVFVAFCAMLSADAQTVYSVNIVGCVPDMTIELLTAPLTLAQRQALHAQNFNNLPLAARPYYLHTVAYAVGYTVASNGQVPDSAMLAEHLQNVASIYDVPPVPPELSESLAAYCSRLQPSSQDSLLTKMCGALDAS